MKRHLMTLSFIASIAGPSALALARDHRSADSEQLTRPTATRVEGTKEFHCHESESVNSEKQSAAYDRLETRSGPRDIR
jgi:hypothetical protein